MGSVRFSLVLLNTRYFNSFKSMTKNCSSLVENSHDHKEGPFTAGFHSSLLSTGHVPMSTEWSAPSMMVVENGEQESVAGTSSGSARGPMGS